MSEKKEGDQPQEKPKEGDQPQDKPKEETSDELLLDVDLENEAPDELQITPVIGDCQWFLKCKEYDFLLTISVMAGRLKLTVRDSDEHRVPLNTYSCSWTYGELIEKNNYLQLFDDITYIEDLIKCLMENKNRVCIKGKSDDPELIVQLRLPTRIKPELELTVSLIEKNEEERKIEEQKAASLIKQRMEELEQGIFNLAVDLKEVTDRNNIEWNVEEFPKDILDRVRENWIKSNPDKHAPWLPPKEEEIKKPQDK